MREKLVKLLINSPGLEVLFGDEEEFAKNADWLIANGVTVQEWISVKDRLPENGETAICFLKRGECWVATWNEFDDNLWSDGENWCSNSNVTHWMPLPEPPKGE